MALSPAEYVIRVFGGVRKTARAIGRSPGAVSTWRLPKKRNGRGGRVPGSLMEKILVTAKKMDLDINAYDLIHGRAVDRRTDKRVKKHV